MPTYYVNNIEKYLHKSLNSILDQTYDNWFLYLVGDDFKHFDKLIEWSSIIPSHKIKVINTHYSERELKDIQKIKAWGGTNASNYGIGLALNDGYDYICRLDHDDYWTNSHLLHINEVINYDANVIFCCTKGYYLSLFNTLPKINNSSENIIDYKPKPSDVLHSTTCVKFSEIPFRYEHSYRNDNITPDASDAILWKKISEYIKDKNLKSYCYNTITCYHLEEGKNKTFED